jgi:diguanylate cyclase
MRERAVRALEIEQELQRALDRGELRLFFQPTVELSTGEMVAAEALVRWEHPERGLLGPNAFLDVAEETGLIVPMEPGSSRRRAGACATGTPTTEAPTCGCHSTSAHASSHTRTWSPP